MAVPHTGRHEAMANTSFWPPSLGMEAPKVRARKNNMYITVPLSYLHMSVYTYINNPITPQCLFGLQGANAEFHDCFTKGKWEVSGSTIYVLRFMTWGSYAGSR